MVCKRNNKLNLKKNFPNVIGSIILAKLRLMFFKKRSCIFFWIWGQIRVYIGLFDKNTKEYVLIGINSYFISSSINWLGEVGVDAVEAQGNNEVIVLDPLAATFLAFSFSFWMRSFLGISFWVSMQPTLNKLKVFLK